MKDKLTVYWSPAYESDDYDWNFLYPKPKSLFSSSKEHILTNTKDDVMSSSSSILACPAISTKFKKIAVFESPISCSYDYDFTNLDSYSIIPTSKSFISAKVVRNKTMDYAPPVQFSLGYILFCEEPLNAFFTPPMFHPPKYSKSGSIIPGEFDIGRWFRSYNMEIQLWSEKGTISFEENEPLFYVDFKTDKKIEMQRFKLNDSLRKASRSCIDSSIILGKSKTLEEKYDIFMNTDMRDLILTEIKNNIVTESKPIDI